LRWALIITQGKKMSLIEQIYQAVQNQLLIEPFTTDVIKTWASSNGVAKDNGNEYAESYLNSLLSDSDIATPSTSTNGNQKVLKSSINSDGKKEYSFVKKPN
jgi:hypothetical protein